MEQPIILVVQFNWPKPFLAEHGSMARALHDAVTAQEWIEEKVAASGGVGGGQSSIWIFKLPNYAALGTLFNGDSDVSKAYAAFFRAMDDVEDFVREEVRFI